MRIIDYIHFWMFKKEIPRTRESELSIARVMDNVIHKVKKTIGAKRLE